MDRAGGGGRDVLGVVRRGPRPGGWRGVGGGGIPIVSSIVLEALAEGSLPKGDRRTDARDKQNFRDSEFAGHWLLVVGAFVAMVMALTRADHFWIANVLYLAFTLAAILSSIVKIAAYRRGYPLW